MALALICIFASLLVFIILTETLTIYISRTENVSVIEIHLIVFALILTKNKTNKNGSRKKHKDNDERSVFLKSILPRIIRMSEVTVENLEISLPLGDPFENALRQGIYCSLISSLIAFAEGNARFLKIHNIKIFNSEHNNSITALDLKVKISLLDALICYASHIAESTFNKKGGRYYVRKQNE